MKTDELINVLGSTAPARPLIRLTPLVAGLGLVFVALTAAVLGFRPELTEAAVPVPPSFYFKTAFFAALVLVSLRALQTAARPLGQVSLFLPVFLTAGLVAGAVYDAVSQPLPAIMLEFASMKIATCLITVAVYSAMGAGAVVAALRRYAPADARHAALWAGVAAAAVGALGYSLHCQSDSALFILLAYGAPCLAVTLLTRLIAPRFLKW